MIKEPVKIILHSKIKRDKNTIELIKKEYHGFISLKNNNFYMQYKDDEIGNILVKINEKFDEIIVNYVNQHKKMIFNNTKETQLLYDQLLLKIKTQLISLNMKSNLNYDIFIKYKLFHENNRLGIYELKYEIRN